MRVHVEICVTCIQSLYCYWFFIPPVHAYQGLFKVDYNFPDELYSHKLILSECPPPIPVKKRKRNTVPKVRNLSTTVC